MVGGRHTRLAVGNSRRQDLAQQRTLFLLLIGSVLIVGGLISLFTVRGFRILGLRQQLASSLLAYDRAMEERLVLENHLSLQDDLAAIEDAVRDRLGWVKPGEERVIFVDPAEALAEEGE